MKINSAGLDVQIGGYMLYTADAGALGIIFLPAREHGSIDPVELPQFYAGAA